jgi:hypothetical protein
MALRNPPVVPADTAPDVWRRQMQIIAKMSMRERVERWKSFNVALAEMEEAAVRRAHPEMTDDGVFYELVRRRYGDEVATAAWPDKARSVR